MTLRRTPPVPRRDRRHEAERLTLVCIANEVTTMHALLVPAETPEAVYVGLKDAHEALLRALSAHDAAHPGPGRF